MARRKKPKITGSDPEYTSGTHQFTKLPTNKAVEPTSNPVQPVASAPASDVVEPVETKPGQARTRKTPATKKPAETPKPVAAESSATRAEGTRRVELLAALTPALHDELQKLESLGIAYKDAMSMAGRRATKEFEASPAYVDKTDADRLPTAQAYRSSKSLPVPILEKLHDEANPLRLASDGAMVRGQFEPLFWQHLEAVIKELNDKYSK